MKHEHHGWCRHCGNYAVLSHQHADDTWWCECILCRADVMGKTAEEAVFLWNVVHGDRMGAKDA